MYKPCHRFLKVELCEIQKESEETSAVLLPAEYLKKRQQRYRKAKLVGVASKCEMFSEEDLNSCVVLDTTMVETFVDENKMEHLFILENNILAYEE